METGVDCAYIMPQNHGLQNRANVSGQGLATIICFATRRLTDIM